MIDLPAEVTKYFWGDDLTQLSWERNRRYITQTLLERGDAGAVRWLLSRVERKSLREQIDRLKMSPKSSNYWQLYLA